MGNQVSLRPSDGRGKIVWWDGSVHEIEQSVTVAELMLEHPEQVVVELHSAVNQKRPTPLPADNKLETNKAYLMIPVKRGKPVGLSGEETRRILFILNSALHSKSLVGSSKFVPWLTRLCQNTTIVEPGRKEEEREKNEERCQFSELLPEILEARPEYLNRQLSGKGWKPTLDTIKEKNIDRKHTHWLFLRTF
ncbi:uncharacterized protein LOC114192283 [Vigna unguiculata]|uniref:Uncharacterized protein n=1 Tax=Vigna unguiculata TaxID=3917 RepID=A0A4D6N3S3_VIGUN|nr:uncharacterized protein LOC114192283 [Vigna unguiculata]QCE06667.1 hypothetical protein DEO72_LG9g1681 [Vigna unguiculata]